MKKNIIIFCILSSLLLALFIIDSYAALQSITSDSEELDIASWKILVNDEDISVSKDITLNDFKFLDSNSHAEEGILAPGVNAYYEVVVDTSQSDVSIDYNFEVVSDFFNDHPNIQFHLFVDGVEVDSSVRTFTGLINYNDTNKVKTFMFVVDWEQDDDYDLTDSDLINQELPIKINATFVQHVE